MNGIDVSNNNNIRDWNVLKQQGVQTVIQKATQGVDYTDPLFEYRYSHIKQAGLKFGVYHFAGGLHPAEQEAKYFINAIKGKQLDTVCFLDIENYSKKTWQKQEAINFCNAWLNYVKSKGYKVGLYTGESFYNSFLRGNISADIPLWIASYGKKPNTYPTDSWQYTGNGKLNGIIGNLDLDIFQSNIFLQKAQSFIKLDGGGYASYKGGTPGINLIIKDFSSDIQRVFAWVDSDRCASWSFALQVPNSNYVQLKRGINKVITIRNGGYTFSKGSTYKLTAKGYDKNGKIIATNSIVIKIPEK